MKFRLSVSSGDFGDFLLQMKTGDSVLVAPTLCPRFRAVITFSLYPSVSNPTRLDLTFVLLHNRKQQGSYIIRVVPLLQPDSSFIPDFASEMCLREKQKPVKRLILFV